MTNRELATRVAWSLHGLPYRWGGDDPVAGFDCSGFVIELLKSADILPRDGDWTAQQLYERFADRTVIVPVEGCLAFWRRGGRMTHVEYCVDWSTTIGASGGGSSTTDESDAIQQNAYVKVRPIRSGAVFCDPFLVPTTRV